MQNEGDEIQQDPPRTSEMMAESNLSSHEIRTYSDALMVLSEVELPSSSPAALATSCTLTKEENVVMFHEGQTSGKKRKPKEIEEKVGREREVKSKQHDYQQTHHQSVAADINTKEKRRRNRISERISTLQALVPNCNKRDTASILGDAIDYIKFLQMQLQAGQPSFEMPNFALQFATRPSIDVLNGMPQYGFYNSTNFPVYQPYFSRFPPLMPRMEMGIGAYSWRQPRTLLSPQQLQFPRQTLNPMYSTMPSLGTITPTTCSQARSTVHTDHTAATSQGMK